MSERMDAKWKQLAQDSRVEIPDLVRARIDLTLTGLPEKEGAANGAGVVVSANGAMEAGTSSVAVESVGAMKEETVSGHRSARGKRLRRVAVALALIAALYGSGFVSPTMAGVLSKIPIVGAVFMATGDIGLKQAQLGGFTTAVDQSVTDQGITLKITDVVYDSTQFAFGMAAHVPNEKDGEIGISDMEVHYPNAILRFERKHAGNSVNWVPAAGDHEYTALMQDNHLQADLPEQFEANVIVKKVGNTEGHWEFKFPVSIEKAKSASRTFTPNLSQESNGWEVRIEAVHFTPTNTTLDLKMKSQQLDDESLSSHSLLSEVEVLDDQGRELPPMFNNEGVRLFGSMSSRMNQAGDAHVTPQFAPMKELPKFLTVRVKKDPQLEFKIPLE